MSVYIYSTMTGGQAYTEWRKGGGDLQVRGRVVHIGGGANIADKVLVTRSGVVTKITDAEYALLKTIPAFNEHVERGFVKVQEGGSERLDRALNSMNVRDLSAPLTDADIERDTQAAQLKGSTAAEKNVKE